MNKEMDMKKLDEAYNHGKLEGENILLKQILEQLLKIELTPILEPM